MEFASRSSLPSLDLLLLYPRNEVERGLLFSFYLLVLPLSFPLFLSSSLSLSLSLLATREIVKSAPTLALFSSCNLWSARLNSTSPLFFSLGLFLAFVPSVFLPLHGFHPSFARYFSPPILSSVSSFFHTLEKGPSYDSVFTFRDKKSVRARGI